MKTKVWAHRGASGYAPENTLPAFELAVSQKADGVELDVQLTKDNKMVVFHDETLERVTNGTGFIKDYTLEELKQLNCKNRFSSEENIKIPTLDEVYELLAPTGLTVNVELKTGVFPYEGIENMALEIAKNWNVEDKVIYSSFYHPGIMKMKELDKDAKVGLLYADGFIDVPEYAEKLGVLTLHPPIWRIMDRDFVKKCKEKNIALHVWFCDEEQYMKLLVENQIEAIITNYPDIARRVVDSNK